MFQIHVNICKEKCDPSTFLGLANDTLLKLLVFRDSPEETGRHRWEDHIYVAKRTQAQSATMDSNTLRRLPRFEAKRSAPKLYLGLWLAIVRPGLLMLRLQMGGLDKLLKCIKWDISCSSQCTSCAKMRELPWPKMLLCGFPVGRVNLTACSCGEALSGRPP